MILLAAAPCTAMVFVWSRLTGGDPYFTLSQVALNDAIMVVAFAPIVGLLLGLSAIVVPWDTLFVSVLLYIVIPVIIAQAWRALLLRGGERRLHSALDTIQPFSTAALLATIVLLFGFQGRQILAQPLIIAMLAVPIIIQVYFNSALAYWLNRRLRVAHSVAGPSALIGASNFFELAVAAAITLFGFDSGAALATVVGVLVEVPVMLSVVAIVNRTRGWYQARRRMIEALNADCFCIGLDRAALRAAIDSDPAGKGLSTLIEERCPHLFASVPLFVSRRHVDEMAKVIAAVETVVASAAYRQEVLSYAPDIARLEPGSRGAFIGYDFHLGAMQVRS